MAITEAIDWCVYNASRKKMITPKPYFTYVLLIRQSVKLPAHSHADLTSSEQTSARKKWSEPWTAPLSCRKATTNTITTNLQNSWPGTCLEYFCTFCKTVTIVQRTIGQSATSYTVWGVISHSCRTSEPLAWCVEAAGDNRGQHSFYLCSHFHWICNTCSTTICMNCLFEWNRIYSAQSESLGVVQIGFE